MKKKRILQVISVMLISAFLMLDVSWAGGTAISAVQPKEMLSAPIQIRQQQFAENFDQLYQANEKKLTSDTENFLSYYKQNKALIKRATDNTAFLFTLIQKDSNNFRITVSLEDKDNVIGHADLSINSEKDYDFDIICNLNIEWSYKALQSLYPGVQAALTSLSIGIAQKARADTLRLDYVTWEGPPDGDWENWFLYNDFVWMRNLSIPPKNILITLESDVSTDEIAQVLKLKAVIDYKNSIEQADESIIAQITYYEIWAHYLEKVKKLNALGVPYEVVPVVQRKERQGGPFYFYFNADEKSDFELTDIQVNEVKASKDTKPELIKIKSNFELNQLDKTKDEKLGYYARQFFYYADYPELVETIVSNMVELKADEVVDTLIAMLNYSSIVNFANNLIIIKALGQLGNEKAKDFLIGQLQKIGSQEYQWAEVVLDALEKVGVSKEESIEILIDAAISELDNRYSKAKAASVLERIGAKAKRALFALEESLENEPLTRSRIVGYDGIADVSQIGLVEEENITRTILQNAINRIKHFASLPKAQETARKTVQAYFKEVQAMDSKDKIEKLDKNQFYFSMNEEQQLRYLQCIKDVLKEKGVDTISPAILFKAAERATENDHSDVKARIGLQPGTMNPLHFGHISASLGEIISEKVNMVLLANGGTVPDKPYAASADIRNTMARIAVNETGEAKKLGLNQWLQVTPVRAQTVDMFSSSPELLNLAGKNEKDRRFNMDMAGFIWLFAANRNVDWVYLVGSDKVGAKGDEPGYGEKGEVKLVKDTLAKAGVQIVYFERTGKEVDYENKIKPYSWLDELWESTFKRSDVGSFADLAAVQIRKALSDENDTPARDRIVGKHPLNQSIPEGVIDYITADTPEGKQLRFLYPLENEEKSIDKLLKNGKQQEALQGYESILEKIIAEKAKPEDQRQASIAVLESAQKNLNKKIEKIDLQYKREKSIHQLLAIGDKADKISIPNVVSMKLLIQAI